MGADSTVALLSKRPLNTVLAEATRCEDYYCDTYLRMEHFEFAASVLEMLASFGWVWSWCVTRLFFSAAVCQLLA